MPDPVATSLSMLHAAADRTVLAEAVLRHLASRIAGWRAAAGVDASLALTAPEYAVLLGRMYAETAKAALTDSIARGRLGIVRATVRSGLKKRAGPSPSTAPRASP